MERRIFGLENEYGVTCTLRGQRRLSPDEVARYLFRRVVSWGRCSNVFLANGARLYLDVGSPPRVRHARVRLDLRPRRPRQGGRAHPRAAARVGRAAPARGGHPGRHLPVQEQHRLGRQQLRLPRELPHQPARRLRPLRRGADPVPRVSRQIYAGAGKVLQTARGAMYCISQRAEHIWEGVSSATTRSRPDHQHPRRAPRRRRALPPPPRDRGRLQHERVRHVPQGRAPPSILLRMLEDPSVVLRDMTLENPIRAIREISHDITCKRRVRLANGREAVRARDPERVPQPGPALRRDARGSQPAREAGARDVGALPHPASRTIRWRSTASATGSSSTS